MGVKSFPKQFLFSGRTGFYLRVLKEGDVGAGDAIKRIHSEPENLTVREISHLRFFDKQNLAGAKNALRIEALSPRWRGAFEEILGLAPSSTGL